jgi:hypothetical protein
MRKTSYVGSKTHTVKSGTTPGGRKYKTITVKGDDGSKTKNTALYPKNSKSIATFSKYTNEDGGISKRAYRKPNVTETSISARHIQKGPTKPLKKKK